MVVVGTYLAVARIAVTRLDLVLDRVLAPLAVYWVVVVLVAFPFRLAFLALCVGLGHQSLLSQH
jgi:hypothetical protein